MAEYNAAGMTLVVPGPLTITFNAAAGDTYVNDPDSCSGLDGAPVRAPIDKRPQTDGGIVHKFLKDARHITLGGDLRVRSAGDETGFVTARNTLEDALLAACEAILQADGTLTIPRTGGSDRTLTVRCDILPTFAGTLQKTYLFGLVAADPDWS